MVDPAIDGIQRSRPRSLLAVALTATMALVVAIEAVYLAVAVIADPVELGMDYRYYVSLGERWLADGTFYLPHQLAGPHEVGLLGLSQHVDTLYPPPRSSCSCPSSGCRRCCGGHSRSGEHAGAPSPSSHRLDRPVMFALLAYPRAIGAYLFGNTDIVIVAAVAGGLVWGWPAILVTIKPRSALA